MSRNDPINNSTRAFLPGKVEQNLRRHQGMVKGHLIALLSLDRRRETLAAFVSISSVDVFIYKWGSARIRIVLRRTGHLWKELRRGPSLRFTVSEW